MKTVRDYTKTRQAFFSKYTLRRVWEHALQRPSAVQGIKLRSG